MLTLQDFEIEIAAGDGQAYPVSVLRSPSGQARSVLRLPSETLSLSEWIVEVQDTVSSEQADVSALQSVGQALFESLFCDDVGRIYDLSQQAVRAQNEGLRIKLRINAPELTALPWELLYSARQGEFVTLSRYTPLVRYLELPLPDTDLAIQAPLRILGMIATPSDELSLDVAREKSRFEQAIQDLRRRGLVELSWIEGQTWHDLQASLQQGPWHVFHFIGHAVAAENGDSSALLLADEHGRSTPLTGNQLGRLLADHQPLRLALLNACEGARGSERGPFSSLAAELVRRGQPAVLAMQNAISDRAAVEFSASFYGALAANLPIDAAVSEARKAISLALPNSAEWATPVLYMRAPDGVLWHVEKTAPETVVQRLKALSWPILLTPLLVLSVLGFLAYPRLKPLWAPAPMTGQFRIAIAEFGQIDASGKVKRSEPGQVLSQWLFEALYDAYEQNSDLELAQAIQVWHDSDQDTEQNFRFGMVRGDTPDAREAAAAALADRVKAHMVIYGYLTDDSALQQLELGFYLSPLVNDETAAVLGPHQLGRPIALPVPLDLDRPEASILIEERLQARTDALFWLTMGLTQDALGRSEQALETLLLAEQALGGWPDDDGKELLHFFIGRASLLVKRTADAEAAFRRALSINPTYARAQVGLGSTYLVRARTVQPEARLQPPSDLMQAIAHHQDGIALAQDDVPLVLAIARIAFAKSQRLLGETLYVLDRFDEAQGAFTTVVGETEQAIQVLKSTKQYRITAQAYEVQGAAYLQRGDILRRQAQIKASRDSLDLARTAYAACVAQGVQAPFDAFLREQVIEQGCLRYDRAARDLLNQIEREVP